MHAVERGRGDHVAQHFDGVVLDDAHVLEMQLGDALQQTSHAGGMHFDAEIIVLGMLLRDCRGGLAHAEADLENLGRRAAEHAVQIKGDGGERDAVYRQEIGVGAALRVRDAPLAQDETADRAPFLQGSGASRPASTAFFIARAISTGFCARATAVFMSTASQPSSMAIAASEAVPTPASTTTGTLAWSMMSCRFQGLRMPIPEPISEASGMTATQPSSSSCRAMIGSSLV